MSTLNPGNITVFVTSVGSETNPAAGAEKSIPATLNMRSELINLSFQFAADANAADREIYIQHTHNSVVNRLGSLQVALTANQTFHIICNQGPHAPNTRNVVSLHLPIPSYPFIFEGDTIDIKVTNIQVGDAITVIKRAWKLWIYEQ